MLGRHAGTIGWMDVETAGAVTRHVAALTVGGEHRDMQVHSVRRADGMLLECEFYYSLLLDRSGKPVSVSAQILDVTERRRAEETQHLLIGEDPFDIEKILAKFRTAPFYYGYAGYAAVAASLDDPAVFTIAIFGTPGADLSERPRPDYDEIVSTWDI